MTVGGAPYIIAVFWNVYAQRWYFSATVQGQQTPALTMPMVGSDGNDTPVNLVWALFGSKASMAYYPAAQTIVTVT